MTSGPAKYEAQVSGGQGAIIGDYATVFQSFTTAPSPLASHIRVHQFSGVVDDRTRAFVGREFLLDAIDGVLRDESFRSGYVVLRGEPGIGKTSVLAHLISSRRYVHHLNIAPMNIRSPEAFLANVCAQLIVRYGLDHDHLPDTATRDGGFLAQLLAEASAVSANLPLVVVVDALDEAEDHAAGGANRLFLPPTLPPGVFFVVSSRERHDHQLYVDSRRDIYLRDDDPQNLADIATYVTNRLREHGMRRDGLAEILVDRSEGNFMYVVYVLGDLLRGSVDIEDVDALPHGLRAYYQRHWGIMRARDPDLFDRYQAPLVCFLATAREPVTLARSTEWIARYWKQSRWDVAEFRPRTVVGVVRNWREFLNEEGVGADARYRLYHTSFQEFLRDEVGLAPFHDTIGAVALDKIDGLVPDG
ncbi:ATP-binding protein [Micromonospora sp. WMMD1102]|uniref:ATP-binding protein n=1 Tax=Micromonospora sp. WMMD1102 TaxID=3016105 RepID=UPI0024153355|nr:ATP-binding protein [Micromonospora sp. WMMD1102]MDG4785303.1 ATP-binding protein [Micromonospora sp. WMMD1102]